MGQGAWTAAYGFIFNEAGALLDDGFPRTIPADANPDTYRPYDEGQAWATAVNDPNFKLQMAGIMALPLVPLTVAALPEVYAGVLLYPETVFIGAGFAEGITPPLSGVSVNAYGYAAGVAASNYLPKGMIGP